MGNKIVGYNINGIKLKKIAIFAYIQIILAPQHSPHIKLKTKQIKEMIEEMENLCEKINQEGRKITMIGESMGAIITLKLATKIKLEKIVVLSTPIKGVKKELIIERINTKNKFLKTINKKEEEIYYRKQS